MGKIPSSPFLMLRTWLAIFTHGVLATGATFFPSINMTDSSGTPIQAHGGTIIQGQGNDSSWYWFGEDKTGETTSGSFIGVSCYRSSDFSTWDNLGHVLSPVANTNISSDSIVERPKVLYNDRNDEYVMWFHSDDSSYSAAMVGVATSKTIGGKYTWQGSFKPLGQDSRDMTVWKDPDTGAGYLIFATNGNADMEVASMTDDYHNVARGLHTFSSVYQEAPGVLKVNGTYYLLYSPQDGWTPTPNAYYTAPAMAGPWSTSTLLAPANAYTYLTQNTYDLTIHGSKTTTYLYFADHWNGNLLGASTYSFLPLVFSPSSSSNSPSSLSLHHTNGWTLDFATGTWSDLPYTFITAANSSTPASTLVACQDSCAGGKAANMTATQSFAFTWSGTAGYKVIQILYTYNGPKNAFLRVGATVDGSTAAERALLETSRGMNFAQAAPLRVKLAKGSKVALTLDKGQSTGLWVEGIEVFNA